jgi:hypothetical protein
MRKLTTAEWIEKAKIVHGNKYSYNSTIYTKAKESVSIVCVVHGVFIQTAQHHISGHGCPKCSNNYKYTNVEFILKANEAHKNKYTYKNCIYSNNKLKITITCSLHGDFLQAPMNHLQGQGCPTCNKVNTQDFIRKAISEKIKRYYKRITEKPKKVFCPF